MAASSSADFTNPSPLPSPSSSAGAPVISSVARTELDRLHAELRAQVHVLLSSQMVDWVRHVTVSQTGKNGGSDTCDRFRLTFPYCGSQQRCTCVFCVIERGYAVR